MCGICGVFYFNGESADKQVLERMRDSMVYRGPDDCGIFLDGKVGLGHRRLSIIDLIGGGQPIHNEEETVWIVYNGELYNHEDLRVELEGLGHRYYTNTDTETIVHLYEDYGPACVERMNGMFAFAIWDAREKKVFLARDRLGIKPLYYLRDGEKLVFASELKAILEHPDIPRVVDYSALNNYFTYGYIGSPDTVFEGVEKLPPAHTLVEDGVESSIKRYWRITFPKKPYGDEAYHIEKIRSMLSESVSRRLMSDVPLGVFLSGGIDSSAIVAVMSDISDDVKTFSVGFEDQSFNELEYAKLVAEEFGTDHHEFVVPMNAVELLPKILECFDEPFADSSALPTYIVSQMARTSVTVCLSGDGGDELFAGYDRYVGCKVASAYGKLPGPLRMTAHWFTGLLPASTANKSIVNFSKRFAEVGNLSEVERYADWLSFFNREKRGELFSKETMKRVGKLENIKYLDRFFRECPSKDFLVKTMYVDVKTYLPEDLLTKVDRASMAHSLEVRVPFLDHEFVEYAQTIPMNLKFPGLKLKYLLKKAMKDRLPKKIIGRRKQGFGVPVSAWFKGDLKGMAYDLLLGNDSSTRDFFNKSYLRKILDEHSSGRVDHGQRIWSLVFFDLWMRKYVNGERISL
ncbi:MAG: asparagine synthase (glutamine-hydrolyzing) [Methanobacteriota archaeon]